MKDLFELEALVIAYGHAQYLYGQVPVLDAKRNAAYARVVTTENDLRAALNLPERQW